MQTHDLKRNTKNKKDRVVGRGGVHARTAGRGMKGQSARAGNKKRPQIRDMIKKLPKLRGYRFNSRRKAIEIPADKLASPTESFSEIRKRLKIKGSKIKIK